MAVLRRRRRRPERRQRTGHLGARTGVVNYPDGMGVPIHSTAKLIVQVHYNLVDPASVGKTDSTTIHLRFAPTVSRQLAFLLPDPFLDSLNNATPDTLPPGQADAKYTWTKTGKQIGLNGVASADLIAVMPHMHGRGLRQTMTPRRNLRLAPGRLGLSLAEVLLLRHAPRDTPEHASSR